MSYINYYDRNNRPIADEEYYAKFENREYQRVIASDVGPYWVSTVWLGLDHAFMGGPPLIFETMVFSSRPDSAEGLGDDLECRRWTTEHQAILGHYEVVHEVEQAIARGESFDGYHAQL